MSFLHTGRSVEYLSLGCFVRDLNSSALISMEIENATFLDGDFQTRDNAVMKCALEAAKNDYKVFALQNGGECFSGSEALNSYAMHGYTHCPNGGKGGHLINEVYLLGGWSMLFVHIKLDVLQGHKKPVKQSYLLDNSGIHVSANYSLSLIFLLWNESQVWKDVTKWPDSRLTIDGPRLVLRRILGRSSSKRK